MGYKYNSIIKLRQQGLNTHETFLAHTKDELELLIHQYGEIFSVREDSVEVRTDLPFYISMDDIPDTPSKGESFIFSNGRKHDENQLINFVATIRPDGDFEIELSPLKIPLRHMYRYPESLCYVTGNICEKQNQWITRGKCDLQAVSKCITFLYIKNIFKRVECTLYPYNVGQLNEPIIFWQID